MPNARILTGAMVALALAACSPAEMPRRDLSPATSRSAAAQPLYNVVAYNVSVPDSLLVSEADVFLPIADIVWHGDPVGERHQQVKAIFEAALAQSTADMTQGRRVQVSLEVIKFHALTPKTRATLGGNFAMHFYLTVVDSATHQVLDGPRKIVADIRASGGVKALREEAEGITQKSVITGHLIEVFDRELARRGRPKADAVVISSNGFLPPEPTLAE
jgi:hypothetical protein